MIVIKYVKRRSFDPPLLVFYQYILILLAISAECERIVRLASMSASFMFGVINASSFSVLPERSIYMSYPNISEIEDLRASAFSAFMRTYIETSISLYGATKFLSSQSSHVRASTL